MRFRTTIFLGALVVALLAVPVTAEETGKKEPPKPQPKSDAKKDEAAKAGEKTADGKAAPTDEKAAKEGEAPKAAVNTLEDLFASRGLALPAALAPAPAAVAPVEWRVSTPAPKAAPVKKAPQASGN